MNSDACNDDNHILAFEGTANEPLAWYYTLKDWLLRLDSNQQPSG